MAQKSSSSPPRYSLDTSNSQLGHEDDLSQDFLTQNDMISQEIWKCDKSLYCPTRTFKVLALIYLLSSFTFIQYSISQIGKGFDTFLPKNLFYAHLVITLFLFLMAMWACFVSWRVIYSKDPFKLDKPILIFKSYFCFVVCIEVPVFLYYMTENGLSYGSKLFFHGFMGLLVDVISTATGLLLAMRIKNILMKHKPFHDASSFYANSNASFLNQKV